MGIFRKPKVQNAQNGDIARSKNEKKLLEIIGSKDEFLPTDGGWGWVVCLVSFWCNGTIFGILNTFGILYVKLLEEHETDEDKSDIAFKICKYSTFLSFV